MHRMRFTHLIIFMTLWSAPTRGQESTYADPSNANMYLTKNYKNSDWFNGNTPYRLKNLIGSIKKLEQKEYYLARDGRTLEATPNVSSFTLFFNRQFEIIEERGNAGRYAVTFRSFIEGNVLETKWFDENGKIVQLEVFDYGDSSDFPTEFYTKRIDGTESRIVFTLDTLDKDSFIYHGRSFDELYVDNKLIERKANYSELKFKYAYSANGYVKASFMGDAIFDEERFDAENYLIKIISYDHKGLVVSVEERKYDSSHNLVETEEHDLKTDFYSATLCKYNTENLLIEKKQSDKNGVVYGYNHYEYDPKRNLIREQGDYKNTEIKYVYDNVGNWIERVEIEQSKVIHKSTRQIEYYD
jgi:hypothetical protein